MSPYPPLPPSMSYLQEKVNHGLEHAHQTETEFKSSVARSLESIDKEDHFPTRMTCPGKLELSHWHNGLSLILRSLTPWTISFIAIDPSTLYLLCYALRMYVMDLIFVVFWSYICLTIRRRQARLVKADTALSKPSESLLARFLIIDVFGRTVSLSLSSFSLKDYVFASILTAPILIHMKLPMVASTCSTISITQLAGYFLVAVLRQILVTPTQPSMSPPSLGRRVSVSHDRSTPKTQSWFPSTIALPSASFVFGFPFATCLIVPWVYRHTNAFGVKSHPAPALDVFLQNGVPYTISKAAETHAYPEDDGPLQADPWFLARVTALLAAATLCQILFQNRRHRLRTRDRRIREVKNATGNSSSRRTSSVRLRIPDGWYGQLFLVVACVVWGVLPSWAAFLLFLVTGHLVLTHRVMASILKQVPVLPFLEGLVVKTLPSHPDMRTRLEVLAYNLVLCPVLQWMMRHYTPTIKKTCSPPLRSPWLARIASNATAVVMYFIKASCYCLYNCPRTRNHVPTKYPLTSFTTKNVFSVPGSDGQDSIPNPEPLLSGQRKGRRGNRGLIRISTAKEVSSWPTSGQDKQTTK